MKRKFTVIVCTLWFISVMISCVGVPPKEDSYPPLRSSEQQPTSGKSSFRPGWNMAGQPMNIDWEYILALPVDEAAHILQQYADMQQMPRLSLEQLRAGVTTAGQRQQLFERLLQQYVELKRLQGDKDNEASSKQKIVWLTLSYGNYEGEVKDGKPHGQGTYYLANRDRYVGNWTDGKYNGQGTFYFANGDRYEGEFKNSLFNGQGTFYYANGARYIGAWAAGDPSGGWLYKTDGTKTWVTD